MFVVIDRRTMKVAAKAPKRAELPKDVKGMVVDTEHLERVPADEMLALYHEFGHGEVLPPWAVAKVKEALEAANGKLTAKLAKPESEGAKPPHTGRKSSSPTTSQGEGAVATVRRIASKMKGKTRKDVIAACVAAGVNENTAKTQYQRWFKAQHT